MAEKKVWFGFSYEGTVKSHLEKVLFANNIHNPHLQTEAEEQHPDAPIQKKIFVQGFVSEKELDQLQDGLERGGMADSVEYIKTEYVEKMPHHVVEWLPLPEPRNTH